MDITECSPCAIQRRARISGICCVCGDFAETRHFGALSCGACRSFFRRAVQTRSYTNFVCEHGGKCRVSKSSRMACRRCRFDKCTDVGMDIKWVMNESERALWKLVRKATPARIPKIVLRDERVTSREQDCIDSLVSKFKDVTLTTTVTLPEISRYTNPDDLVPLYTMNGLVSADLMQNMLHVLNKLQQMHVDEPCIMLLMLVVFFRPETKGVSNPDQVEEVQERMLFILKKYIRWRYGGASGALYAKLLAFLADLQEFCDKFNDAHIFLLETQVEIIEALLGDLSPYKSFSIRRPEPELPIVNHDWLISDLEGSLQSTASTVDQSTDNGSLDTTDLFDLLENVDELF